MVSEVLGVEIERVPLGYGIVALLISGHDDRPAYTPPPPPRSRREAKRDVREHFELEQEEANP